MARLSLSLATCLILLAVSTPIQACPMEADAVIDVGLSSISTPLELGIFRGPDATYCSAWLVLDASALPSRSLVPRPRELAEELVPAAQAYGADTCEIVVLVSDDVESESGSDTDDDACWRGEFRYDGGSWSEIEEQSCYED